MNKGTNSPLYSAKEKQWLNLTVSYHKGTIDLFLNSIHIMNFINCNFPQEVIFGSNESNRFDWYIGGLIRCFSGKIPQNIINDIYKAGIFSIPLNFFKNEQQFITPDHYSIDESSNLKGVKSSSFLSNLSISIGGTNGYMGEMIKLIRQPCNDKNIARNKFINFLNAMIANQQNGLLHKKYLNEFALDISILLHFKSDFFNIYSEELFKTINSCLINHWESLFTLYFDAFLLEYDIIIERLIKIIENNLESFNKKKKKFENYAFRFLFNIFISKNIKTNQKLLLKLISFFVPKLNYSIYTYLNSFYVTNNIDNLRKPIKKHDDEDNAELFHILLDHFKNII